MLKKVFIFVLLALFTTTAYAAPQLQIQTQPEGEKFVVIPDKKNTHEHGKVKMTIFFDFFCPHCHQFDSVVTPLLEREYGKKLQITYIGYPIIYADSVIPVEAFELAKDEGKGEEMKNAIFDAIYYKRKEGANYDVLTSLAQSIGLNAEKFRKRLESGEKKKSVLDGKELAKSYGAKSTPTVIIDGNTLIKDNTLATVSSVIDKILAGDKK
jgi:thiol:disulfide interchange protein DsbA